MSKHSSGILCVDGLRGDGREIVNLNGEAIATTTCRMCADLIVRRFNSHDALLAVARDALAMAELNVPPEAARGIAERARAAIAAAEG